jgi:hypothetical protein
MKSERSHCARLTDLFTFIEYQPVPFDIVDEVIRIGNLGSKCVISGNHNVSTV